MRGLKKRNPSASPRPGRSGERAGLRGRRKHSPPLIEVAAAVIVRNNKILITQRLPHVHLGGLWEFPGGKRDPDETWKASLKRELREELGLTVEVGPFLDDIVHHYPEKSVRLRFYACRCDAGEPLPLACAQLAWATIPQLAGYKFPDADRKFLRDLKADRFKKLLP